MQKKLLPAYIPPRIVRGSGAAWWILWYETNPATGALDRFRKTFSLNRIHNKAQRTERARAILQEISQGLATGGYIYTGQETIGQPFTPLREALELAVKLKMQYDRYDTRKTYRSVSGIFTAWLQAEKMLDWPVMRFGKKEAMAFMDYLHLRRRVGATTYNNYQTVLRVLFNELRTRDFIQANPFAQVPKKKSTQKLRRNFSLEERRTVAAWISQEHPMLFLGVLLSYYCFIRPIELRKMQFLCIDLTGGCIRLPAAITKTKIERTVTLPDSIIPYFEALVKAHPPSWHPFGPGLQPGTRPASKDAFYKAHRKALKQLYQAGALRSLAGLCFYSWKDSGLTDHSQEVGLLDLMQQAGHHDPKITMVYIHKGKENRAFRDMDKPLFGEKAKPG